MVLMGWVFHDALLFKYTLSDNSLTRRVLLLSNVNGLCCDLLKIRGQVHR